MTTLNLHQVRQAALDRASEIHRVRTGSNDETRRKALAASEETLHAIATFLLQLQLWGPWRSTAI